MIKKVNTGITELKDIPNIVEEGKMDMHIDLFTYPNFSVLTSRTDKGAGLIMSTWVAKEENDYTLYIPIVLNSEGIDINAKTIVEMTTVLDKEVIDKQKNGKPFGYINGAGEYKGCYKQKK